MCENEVSKEVMVQEIFYYLVGEKRFDEITEEALRKISVQDLKPAYDVIKTEHYFATEISKIISLVRDQDK